MYHGSTRSMISVIQGVQNDVNTLMIFGHNPGLTDLTNFLSGADIYNIPTCGIAEIDFDITSWKDVNQDEGKLVSFDYPKRLTESSY